MAKSGKQTKTGKAFEYGCLLTIYDHYKDSQDVRIVSSEALNTAKKYHDDSPIKERIKCRQAMAAVMDIFEELEPKLKHPDNDEPLLLGIKQDAAGEVGDVRDVVISRPSGWEIGISCKHNHMAVKHSRLSNQIDFGQKWFGHPCSSSYFNEIKPVFDRLEALRISTNKTMKWDAIKDKEKEVYVPILKAFMKELIRLSTCFADVPTKLIRYLIGGHDFYKVIALGSAYQTKIQVMKLSDDSLNKPSLKVKPITNIAPYKLPTKFYSIDFMQDSNSTIEVACDHGWNVSMRLHNASRFVEASLKFDVNFVGLPATLFTQTEPWFDDDTN